MLLSFEWVLLLVEYSCQYEVGSKVAAKKQTGRKKYVPDHSTQAYKNKMCFWKTLSIGGNKVLKAIYSRSKSPCPKQNKRDSFRTDLSTNMTARPVHFWYVSVFMPPVWKNRQGHLVIWSSVGEERRETEISSLILIRLNIHSTFGDCLTCLELNSIDKSQQALNVETTLNQRWTEFTTSAYVVSTLKQRCTSDVVYTTSFQRCFNVILTHIRICQFIKKWLGTIGNKL